MAEASTGVKDIRDFFEMKTGEFMAQWKKLSDKDKAELKQGIQDKTLTY